MRRKEEKYSLRAEVLCPKQLGLFLYLRDGADTISLLHICAAQARCPSAPLRLLDYKLSDEQRALR